MNNISYKFPTELYRQLQPEIDKWNQYNLPVRIWQKDPYVWKSDAKEHVELSDRLGWLDLPTSMAQVIPVLREIADEIKDKFNHVLLLGMGGSSLAPEVFEKTYGSRPGYPSFAIVDSTHPEVIRNILQNYDLKKTLFVVASKSGGTAETNSFYLTFYDAVKKFSGNPGSQFIALTDPGTKMENIAKEKGFLKIVNTPSEVGGRFSALTPFGMLPASFLGMDVEKFIGYAAGMEKACREEKIENNPGVNLGVVLGKLALLGKDKLTFQVSREFATFPQWAEQLIAESTGKGGNGILPVADESVPNGFRYENDRVFVFMHGSKPEQDLIELENKVTNLGLPVISISIGDKYALAEEFYRWEMATAAAGAVLGINPFDQPDVQLAKTLAGDSLKAYKEAGNLPVEQPSYSGDTADVFGEVTGADLKEIFNQFLASLEKGDYVAFLNFIPYNEQVDTAIAGLRKALVEKYGVATTTGYGPRFLHSTGQLHKGGKNNGLFIQLTDNITGDVDVPDQGYSFGVLVTAQAQGDAKALLSRGRRLLKIKIKQNAAGVISSLI